MATYKESLQRIWHQYEREHRQVPATLRDAVQWGVQRGLIGLPENDPYAKLAEDMAAALGEEYATNSNVEAYNDMKADQPPIPMLFDFRDDVAERRTWEDRDAA